MSEQLTVDDPRLQIGANNPPPDPLTPFQIAEKTVNDIYDETLLWLDGKEIDCKAMADGVGNLLASIRAAETLADETRKLENEPFDIGKALVQAKYAPLIANTKSVKGKTVLAADACKAALRPWLDAEDRRIKEAARKAREFAEAQQCVAQEAYRKAQESIDLKAREDAELLMILAKKADKSATRAEKQTATAGGAMGRAVGLRTVYTPVVVDATVFARYVWANHKTEMDTFLTDLARRLHAAGVKDMPGVLIGQETQAV